VLVFFKLDPGALKTLHANFSLDAAPIRVHFPAGYESWNNFSYCAFTSRRRDCC